MRLSYESPPSTQGAPSGYGVFPAGGVVVVVVVVVVLG